MQRRTRLLLYDSFKAARGALDPLFSPFRSEEHVRKEVRAYILPGLSHPRRRYINGRLGRTQQRSLFRTNVSLVLQEARRRGSYRVAAAALDVALTEAQTAAQLAQQIDPAWVKDAVASCQSVEELRFIEAVLRQHEQQLLASGTAAGQEGFLLTAAFGQSGGAKAARGLRLGDADAAEDDDREDAVASEARSTLSSPNDAVAVRQASRETEGATDDEARVASALTHPPSSSLDAATLGGSGVDDSVWASPAHRAAAGLRRLQRQHHDITAGPNVSFTRYFLHQGLVRNEAELMQLYQSMRARPQDLAFRVVGGDGAGSATDQPCSSPLCSPYARAVHAVLQRRRGVHQVPWLPASMGAYTLDTRDSVPHDTVLSNRQLIRSLARERLVVYQSLSSMLPILFLDPQPGEAILDLCASPGNKAGLILDAMHGATGSTTAASTSAMLPRSGCVVANEAQAARVGALQERLRDASPEIAVTRGRGELFGLNSSMEGSWRDSHSDSTAASSALVRSHEEGSYDGVLVDAPCSGEGRMGRDALSWRLWHPGRGLEFFTLQRALLQRAVELCRVGGRVVYATCTLNPLENEAVVAAVLRACGGAVELVPPPAVSSPRKHTSMKKAAAAGGEDSDDHHEQVPALHLSHGLRRWDVPSSAGGFLRTAADAYAQGESSSRLQPEMFALEEVDGASGEASIGAALHRCCRRVMPHLNGNADGFFVAVLRKKASVSRVCTAATAAAAGVLSSASSSSLALSFAGGGSNVLNDRGLVRLPATNSAVQKHLGDFFRSSSASELSRATKQGNGSSSSSQQAQPHRGCTSVQAFLDLHGWAAMWCEGEGLRLMSQCAVQVLRSHSAGGGGSGRGSSPSSLSTATQATQLLNAGVLAVTQHGELTERGAMLLRPSATHRVLSLPLPYAQLLLSNRTLDVGGSWRVMPAFMQEAEAARGAQHGLLSHPTNAERAGGSPRSSSTAAPVPQWCVEVLSALTHMRASGGGAAASAAGNAIVTIDGAPSSRSAPAEWAAPLAQWSWPVRVEVLQPWSEEANLGAGLVRLHLTLPQPARHRTLALIGRLQGHAHRLRHTHAHQQAELQASATLSPSLAMNQQELYGVPTQASQQHRSLFRGSSPAVAAVAAQTAARQPPQRSKAGEDDNAEDLSSSSTVFEL